MLIQNINWPLDALSIVKHYTKSCLSNDSKSRILQITSGVLGTLLKRRLQMCMTQSLNIFIGLLIYVHIITYAGYIEACGVV